MIITENLSKSYKSLKAVDDVNIQVNKGEIYGFLGLNGAGKTTTIRMLLGLIKADSGNAFLAGYKISSSNHKIWNKVGYMVEVPYAYPNLTVKENLEIIRKLRFIKEKSSVQRIINQLDLESYKNTKAKHLSLGNAQRLGLAKALIHQPEILILDEPANGLDPAGIHDIREMLSDMAKYRGVTIFISSHILGEISRFATRIGIIHKGKIVKEINSAESKKLTEQELAIKTNDNQKAINILIERGFTSSKLTEDTIIINNKKAIDEPEKIAQLLVNKGYPPKLIQVREEDLEAYFLKTIKENGGLK